MHNPDSLTLVSIPFVIVSWGKISVCSMCARTMHLDDMMQEQWSMSAWMARSCMSPSIRWRLDGCCSCVRDCLPAFKARPLSLTSHLFSRRRPLEGASVSRMCSFPLCLYHGMSTVESLSRAEGGSSSPGVWHGVDGGVFARLRR
jgi:hypothetical protein